MQIFENGEAWNMPAVDADKILSHKGKGEGTLTVLKGKVWIPVRGNSAYDRPMTTLLLFCSLTTFSGD